MSFGIRIFNDANELIIDDTYAQLTLALQGTASASWTVNNHPAAVINYPSSVAYPLVFVRPKSLNSRFYVSYIDASGFKYSSDGPLDYLVFNMVPPTFPVIVPGDMGVLVRSDLGHVLFDSRVPPRPILGVYTAWESSQSPNSSPTTDTLLRNISFVGTAMDGGLPYVSASSLSPSTVYATTLNSSTVFGLAGKFTSAGNLGIYSYKTGSGGATNGVSFNLGPSPRETIFMR